MVLAVEDALQRAVQGGAARLGKGIAHAQQGGELDGRRDAQLVEIDHVLEDLALGDGGAGLVAVIFQKRADEARERIGELGLAWPARP